MSVRLRDGIEITLADGTRVVCDAARPDGDVDVVSHAHGDHAYDRPPAEVVCSPLTLDLLAARRDDPPEAEPRRVTDERIRQISAGHVAGSRATYIDDGRTTYCYTGDCSVRDRLYLDGFDPEPADVLIVEATYGTPEYQFPPQAELDERIRAALAERAAERPVILFGYSLGRAQKLQLLADEAGLDVYATRSIRGVNEVIEARRDVTFPARPYSDDVALGPGTALVAPTGAARSRWVERIADDTGAPKLGFSGWAVDSSFRFRGGYDETFVLTDHADWSELIEIVEAVNPDEVYTNHGFADELARDLAKRGWDARSLKQNQTSLSEF